MEHHPDGLHQNKYHNPFPLPCCRDWTWDRRPLFLTPRAQSIIIHPPNSRVPWPFGYPATSEKKLDLCRLTALAANYLRARYPSNKKADLKQDPKTQNHAFHRLLVSTGSTSIPLVVHARGPKERAVSVCSPPTTTSQRPPRIQQPNSHETLHTVPLAPQRFTEPESSASSLSNPTAWQSVLVVFTGRIACLVDADKGFNRTTALAFKLQRPRAFAITLSAILSRNQISFCPVHSDQSFKTCV
ncbi:hypothetical protein NEUTE2DRAFT_127576 [Neurospora tetrasperma FGSC 2509]|nr:hypothetical protein NEUTE2DRAFT_127576 [Neurospora tetrasperma FGSC 2509]